MREAPDCGVGPAVGSTWVDVYASESSVVD